MVTYMQREIEETKKKTTSKCNICAINCFTIHLAVFFYHREHSANVDCIKKALTSARPSLPFMQFLFTSQHDHRAQRS